MIVTKKSNHKKKTLNQELFVQTDQIMSNQNKLKNEHKSQPVRPIIFKFCSNSSDESDTESNASSVAFKKSIISLTRNDYERESFNEETRHLWQSQYIFFSQNQSNRRNGYENFLYHLVIYSYFRDLSYFLIQLNR